MTMATTDISLTPPDSKPATSRKELDTFDEWFSRCNKTLHYIACRILGGSKSAEAAVENCRFEASRDLPGFESESAFRSWVLRLLIGEALSILHESHSKRP